MTWAVLMLGLACQHPRLHWDKPYPITESAWVEGWSCLDCYYSGDSTMINAGPRRLAELPYRSMA